MKEFDVPVMPMKSRMSVFSVERGHVEREGSALSVMDRAGVRAQLPVAATAVLMLEPGTTISHAAMRLCAESRTLVIWCGEGGVRLYSAGQEGAAHTYRLLRQAKLALDTRTRMAVAREMYRIRFNEEVPPRRSIQQVRGMEGARVRARYQELSREYGVPWRGRNYNRTDWGAGDTINRAVSAANSCLYGLCHAAILVAGYSAAIGFVHTGYPLAFVHDVADLYKMDLSVPVAFRAVAESEADVTTRVRHKLRDEFRRTGFMENVIPMIERVLDAGDPEDGPPEELGGAQPEASTPEDAPWYRPRADMNVPAEHTNGNGLAEGQGATEGNGVHRENMPVEHAGADVRKVDEVRTVDDRHHGGTVPDDEGAAEQFDPLGLNDPSQSRGLGW